MDFNSLVLESLSPIKVIKRLTGKEGMFHGFSDWVRDSVKECGGWLVHYDGDRYLYFYNKDEPGVLNYFILNHEVYTAEEASKEDEQVIKDWEKFRNSLTPDTLDTFEDML